MTKTGPKETELDWQQLNNYLELGASCVDCSEFLGVSEDKIQDHIRKYHNKTFLQYRNSKLTKKRMKLREKQMEVAMEGSVLMLIWLGKQELGQSDRVIIDDQPLVHQDSERFRDDETPQTDSGV